MIRIVVLALLAALPSSADKPAPADRAKARSLYQSATAHYNLSEYREALNDFKETYRLVNDASLLFNIGQCYRQLNDYKSALSFYKAYRRQLSNEGLAEVDRLILEMENAVHAAQDKSPPEPVHPVAVTPPPPPIAAVPAPAVTATAPAPERPKKSRAWIWGVVAGAAAVVAVGVAVGVVYGMPSQDPTPTVGRVAGN